MEKVPNPSNSVRILQFRFLPGLDFSLFHSVHTGSGAHLASYPKGIGGTFLGGKADLSPPSSAQVKNGGAIPPFLHVFMAYCLIN
jgi:hypothetical protein